MTEGAYAGLAVVFILIALAVVVAAHVAVKNKPARIVLYALAGASAGVLSAGLVLQIWTKGAPLALPPLGLVALLAVAIAASVAILWLFGGQGWLRKVPGRIGAGALIFMVLVIAFPPPLAPGWQVVTLVVGLGIAAAVMLGADSAQPRAATATADGRFMFDMDFDGEGIEGDDILEDDEGDGDDWIVVPVSVAGAGGLRDEERGGAGGSASADGSGAVRQPGGTSGSVGVGGDGAGEQPNGNREGAGEDHAGNGVVGGVALAAADRSFGRRPRGRRLAGALVPREGVSGAGAGAGGYDAAGAATAASIAPAA